MIIFNILLRERFSTRNKALVTVLRLVMMMVRRDEMNLEIDSEDGRSA